MRRGEISFLGAAAVVDFYGGFWVEEFFVTFLKGMLKFWEGIINKKYLSHIMVTLKERFKGKIREKCHMLLLVDITELGI